MYPYIIDPGGYYACGENRLMFSFLDAQNLPVASPDRTASVALYDLGASADTPVATAEGDFIWAGLVYAERAGSKTVGLIETFHISQLDQLVARLIELREACGEAG